MEGNIVSQLCLGTILFIINRIIFDDSVEITLVLEDGFCGLCSQTGIDVADIFRFRLQRIPQPMTEAFFLVCIELVVSPEADRQR